MTPFEFGDVILVPFPFTDQSQTKKRPAVVISSNKYNQTHPDIIVMALSSNLSEPAIPLQTWKEAGLPKATAFKSVVSTFEAGLVLRKLGKLTSNDEELLRGLLKNILG